MSKASLLIDGNGDTLLMFECPGCEGMHGVYVKRVSGQPGPTWCWNESLDAPTITPSIRVSGSKRMTDEEVKRALAGENVTPYPVTVSFVRTRRTH